MMDKADKKRHRAERLIATLLIVLVALVAFWEIMSNRSKRPFQAFQLTSGAFADFSPKSDVWNIQRIPVRPDPIEPNILAFVMTPQDAGPAALQQRVVVRLVHGYNMVDCMREKGYQVELLADTRGASENPDAFHMNIVKGKLLQVWRLMSKTGDSWFCVTSMLRDGDFGETNVDTRSMAFPRIGIPDNPGWFPQGLSVESLKNPIHNARLFLRAKWNSSRMDVMTFLGLKQPAWASDDLVTLVAQGAPGAGRDGHEREEAMHLLAAHTLMYEQLVDWRQRNLVKPGEGGTDEQ